MSKGEKGMSFGTNLQYLRKLSGGMTQEALAEKLNVSRQTISKWESDALERVYKIAKENGDAAPKVIGWDFPNLSQEQVNVFKMHGYTAAWIIPDGISPEGVEIKEQAAHKYAAIHIDRPFDNPFVTIPGAYHTLGDFIRTNGLRQAGEGVIPCFETDGESMDVYIACE
jgi:DNA-binding XRE family transcriptional regulator